MNAKTLLVIAGVLGIVFGLGYLLVPGALLAIYGVKAAGTETFLVRFFGGSIVGFGVLAWAARGAPDSDARQAILLSLFVAFTIAFILSLIGQLSGVFNAVGWTGVIIFVLLAIGFGIVRFSGSGSR